MRRRALWLDVFDDQVVDLLSAWGIPYSWGAGRASVTGWPEGVPGSGGGVGYDCSGFAQAALVRLGKLREGTPDRSAAGLWEASRALGPEEYPVLGDLAFYGRPGPRVTHVMVCLGHSAVIGASGGGSGTNADDPRAYVRLERLSYRADLLGVRRI